MPTQRLCPRRHRARWQPLAACDALGEAPCGYCGRCCSSVCVCRTLCRKRTADAGVSMYEGRCGSSRAPSFAPRRPRPAARWKLAFTEMAGGVRLLACVFPAQPPAGDAHFDPTASVSELTSAPLASGVEVCREAPLWLDRSQSVPDHWS